MRELIAKANQAILESRYLKREGRLLRLQASVLASQLGQTIVKSQHAERALSDLKTSLDPAFPDSAEQHRL